jgi:methylated-DNA-protein-cysteine methyltransferase related protein
LVEYGHASIIYKKSLFVKVYPFPPKNPQVSIIECMKSAKRAAPSAASRRIEAILLRIPEGRVTSYGAVAAASGLPNGARQVARLLHARAALAGLPWHRVLKKDGSLALREGGGAELQKALLAAEGVEVSQDGRVDLKRYGWKD